jgi:predicted SAM-dependent methyltransferase
MIESFDPLAHPDRLNLGCGWDIRAGFLNVDLHDFHKPDLVADVTQLEMLPGDHYQEILAQDVLEHLPRQSTVGVLREWSRLLLVGGHIHLRVPSVVDLSDLLRRPENQSIAQQELFVQCLFGTQAYTEDCHYTTFTEPLLRHYLAEADLRPEQWSIRDGWLFEVDAVRVASGEARGADETSSTSSSPDAARDQPAPRVGLWARLQGRRS